MRVKADYTEYERAREILQAFCAYQDRCHQEARERLYELGVYGERAEQIIVDLIQERYLNEERFARSYARGKFKMKKWGWQRIRIELKRKKITDYCLKKARTEIDDDEYWQVLCNELERRDRLEKKATHPYLRRRKLADYLFKRGFESNLIWLAMDELEIGK
ncbi:RecX family transcriptional regulator [Lewinellaceae bacterium SD302]|nr:RecX family transcriptional regulator [Lewinellaceae bacterium SD302]